MTLREITDVQSLSEHIQQNVPTCSALTGRWYPRFVTQIEVSAASLREDPHGKPPSKWLPPGTHGKILNVWSVTEDSLGYATMTLQATVAEPPRGA